MKSDMCPKVSVVIPAYNEGENIDKILKSLKNQDYSEHYEIIVVDNNSTDNTAEIARGCGARVVFEPDKGVCFARQTGFQSSNGMIIASTDADSILPKNWLTTIVAEFKKNPDLVLLSGGYDFYDGNPVLRFFTWLFNFSLFALLGWCSGANMAVDRNAFVKSGGFNTFLTAIEDIELGIRLRRLGKIKRMANFKVKTSARRFNKLGFIGCLAYYTAVFSVNYVNCRLNLKTQNVKFCPGSEISKLGFWPKLAIHSTVAAIVLGIIFSFNPVRAEIIKGKHYFTRSVKGVLLHYGHKGNKKVALTFDDGPDPPYTNQILDILKKEQIKATFFVCGANVEKYPEVMKCIVQDNHTIGNHTYTHRWKSDILPNQIIKEAENTQILIEQFSPKNERLFRFPYGFELPWTKHCLIKDGFAIIPLGITEGDWKKHANEEKILQQILAHLKERTIITLHDGDKTRETSDRSKTVKILKELIPALREQGCQFVSVTDM